MATAILSTGNCFARAVLEVRMTIHVMRQHDVLLAQTLTDWYRWAVDGRRGNGWTGISGALALRRAGQSRGWGKGAADNRGRGL